MKLHYDGPYGTDNTGGEAASSPLVYSVPIGQRPT